jgi:hypothetical protein
MLVKTVTAPLGLAKYYVCYWKPSSDGIPNISETYFDQNQDLYKELYSTLTKGYKSAGEVGLPVDVAKTASNKQIQQIANRGAGATNNINTTTVPPPTCPPPTIVSFSPLTGVTGTILNITGTDLNSVTAVTINGVTTTTGITINNSTNIVVLVPFSNTLVVQNNTINVRGKFGNGNSVGLFTYNPLQASAAPPTVVPNVLPNSNTQPQQTGETPLIDEALFSLTNNGYLKVSIIPQFNGIWQIVSNPYVLTPVLTYKVTNFTLSSNNTFVKETLKVGTIRLGNTYTTNNNDLFYLTDLNVISLVDSDWEMPPTGSRISYTVKILANKILPTTPPTQVVTQWFSQDIPIL